MVQAARGGARGRARLSRIFAVLPGAQTTARTSSRPSAPQGSDVGVCPAWAPSFRVARFGRIVRGMSEAETAAKWAERVRVWRASGASAATFAAGQGFAASTLRWWDSKLTQAAKPRVAMARVVRRAAGRPEAAEVAATSSGATPSASALTLEVDGARIVVRRGFDAELLRQLVQAIGGAR